MAHSELQLGPGRLAIKFTPSSEDAPPEQASIFLGIIRDILTQQKQAILKKLQLSNQVYNQSEMSNMGQRRLQQSQGTLNHVGPSRPEPLPQNEQGEDAIEQLKKKNDKLWKDIEARQQRIRKDQIEASSMRQSYFQTQKQMLALYNGIALSKRQGDLSTQLQNQKCINNQQSIELKKLIDQNEELIRQNDQKTRQIGRLWSKRRQINQKILSRNRQIEEIVDQLYRQAQKVTLGSRDLADWRKREKQRRYPRSNPILERINNLDRRIMQFIDALRQIFTKVTQERFHQSDPEFLIRDVLQIILNLDGYFLQ